MISDKTEEYEVIGMEKKKDSRVVWVDLLRIFCVFSVVVLHVAAPGWYSLSVDRARWECLTLFVSCFRFCVPILFMISGIFFLNPQREYTLKKLFSKNILRLFTAYVFWTAFYAVFFFPDRLKDLNRENLKLMLHDALAPHFHLWFIVAMICIYLIVPFLKKIAESESLVKYFIILSFIFTFVLNTLRIIPKVAEIIGWTMGSAQFTFVGGYTGYFILGYYLYNHELSKKMKAFLYTAGIVSTALTVFVTWCFSVKRGEPQQFLFDYLLLNIFFNSVMVFLFFKDVVSKIHFNEFFKKTIFLLSKLSFGAYLVHEMFIMISSKYLNFSSINTNPLIAVPVLSVGVFMVSSLVSLIISKIPVAKKYII